ncbi:MAG: isoleucine--tRNA ligase [Myxococcales bacterium]|nr:isoleucine--tRNA ligase [Myxococcales bacterium]MCB9580504.1 isoleucine--tRNA ligase [Polyangiaceae bacterium]
MTDRPVFSPVAPELDFPRYERGILELWKERRIFEKSIEQHGAEAKNYVFYEGPPTANGVPHNGHVLTRVMKDLFPRYHSMTGSKVLRKGGWDTHGLPVEVEVEKELRIHGKAAIEEYGVEPFVARCIESVFRYTTEWERLTERIGFWVSLEDAYVTYHRSYVESVWWALSNLFDKGLLYQGHKVVWWWAQGGTALSSAEVGLGYKTVDDPSVYVAFPLVGQSERALVVWTTTPWTLPSNGYAAVRPSTEYQVVRVGEALETKGKKAPKKLEFSAKELIVASALREDLSHKLGHALEVVETLTGEELVGVRYVPPFDTYYDRLGDARVALKKGGDDAMYWRVVAEDFVTLDTGTGIVHIAPAFGEDDNKAHKKQLTRYADPDSVELICAVKPDGTFRAEAGKYAGRWVKDCDKEILAELGGRHLLVFEELYRHEYPYCWRAEEDPLIQMARPAWFIRTTERLEGALANNQSVGWLPEHIKEGRFGDFLRNNVDWALSRERFWGTPLNVWVCEKDEEHKHAPASVAEIEKLNPEAFAYFHQAKQKDPSLSEHLIVHKPWIDHVTFPCPSCGATMKRVPEVIDCWFDSGCMPFAQWGFPHAEGSKESFDKSFPADFISEAIDQTRGWFYSLLMISTLVFDPETQKKLGLSAERAYPHPYKNCIVLGHVCDKEGKKESKSRGNYTPPEIILDRVRMEFGVLSEAHGDAGKPGEAQIAREDLEGMDLADGAQVVLYRAEAPEEKRELTLRAKKKLPRRVVLLAEEDRAALGLSPIKTGLSTMPVEVPRAAAGTRVVIEDEKTPAPGADAFRWFFYAASPPWSNTRHSLSNVRLLQKDFQVKLRNVYSFFTIYANIDGWAPARLSEARSAKERSELDRWMLSELSLAVQSVRKSLDVYMVYDAAQRLVELVEGLSNWYVRRSRARFWAPGLPADKLDAYATLYEALTTIAKLAAPFIPFFSEEMYQNLVVGPKLASAKESVHLESYPEADAAVIDEALSREMAAVREVVSLGLSVRTANKLKVRQPLSRADVVFNDGATRDRLARHEGLIAEELNVHAVHFMFPGHEDGAVSFKLKPNFRALGPRLGKQVQAVKKALEGANGEALHAELSKTGKITLSVEGEALEFSPEEIDVAVEAADGFAAQTGGVGVVVLHTTLTDVLVDEGILREIVSRVQATRKEQQLEFTDRIQLAVGGSERVRRIAEANSEHIARECLATAVTVGDDAKGTEYTLGEESVVLGVEKA